MPGFEGCTRFDLTVLNIFSLENNLGVDPSAQRHMWELISNIGKERAIILTTHSMEEAEVRYLHLVLS